MIKISKHLLKIRPKLYQPPKYSHLNVPKVQKITEILAENKDPKETQTRVHTDLFYALCKLYGLDHTSQYVDVKTRRYLDDTDHEDWLKKTDEEKLKIMDATQMDHSKITHFLYRRDVKPGRKAVNGLFSSLDDKIEQLEIEEELKDFDSSSKSSL